MIKDFVKQKTVFNTDKFEIGKAYAVYIKHSEGPTHYDMLLKKKDDNMLYFTYLSVGNNLYEERVSIDKYLDGEYEIYELEKVIPINNGSVNEMVIDQINCNNTLATLDEIDKEEKQNGTN